MRRPLLFFAISLITILPLKAQFGQGGGFNMNQTPSQPRDDSLSGPPKPPFKFKTYFSALAWAKDSLSGQKVRKDTLQIGRVWSASLFVPGYSQAYNRQFWKIPVAYGAIGASLYMGYQNNLKYLKTEEDRYATYRDLWYTGTFLAYLGTLLDGTISFKSDLAFLPPRASLFSAMIPGLGQAYNGDYWKIPIYCGGLMACGYFVQFNNMQYQRYRNDYNNPDYAGRLTPDNLKWYRDTYRRYRDYSVLATIIVYALTIIDANIFAYLQDFDVSDNLALKISPGIIEPIYPIHLASTTPSSSVGLKMYISF